MAEAHTCPAPGCNAQVPQSQLTCRPHWYSIPKDIRDRVWSGYRSDDTFAHGRAMLDAVAFLKAKATGHAR
jgi:hypothetical protein